MARTGDRERLGRIKRAVGLHLERMARLFFAPGAELTLTVRVPGRSDDGDDG